jgi:hypothetical protein
MRGLALFSSNNFRDKEGGMKNVICFLLAGAVFLSAIPPAWGSDRIKDTGLTVKETGSMAEAYIDLATMHRYVKNSDGTYSQYTRKGEFFKNVPADLPLLTSRSHVVAVQDHCYFLYVKRELSGEKRTLLTSMPVPHPEGWLLDKALVDLKHTAP